MIFFFLLTTTFRKVPPPPPTHTKKVSLEAIICSAQLVCSNHFIFGIAPNSPPYHTSCRVPLCCHADRSRFDELWIEIGICKHPFMLMVPQTSTFPSASGILDIWRISEFSKENCFNDFSSLETTSRFSKKWSHHFFVMETKRLKSPVLNESFGDRT